MAVKKPVRANRPQSPAPVESTTQEIPSQPKAIVHRTPEMASPLILVSVVMGLWVGCPFIITVIAGYVMEACGGLALLSIIIAIGAYAEDIKALIPKRQLKTNAVPINAPAS